MATIKRTIHAGDKPSEAAITEVREAEKQPITCDTVPGTGDTAPVTRFPNAMYRVWKDGYVMGLMAVGG